MRVGQGRWLAQMRPGIRVPEGEAAPAAIYYLLLENGDNLLLEDGGLFELEHN